MSEMTMNDQIPTLSELDRDGALQETAERAGLSRSQFLRRSAFAGGGLIVGGLPVAFSLAQGSSKGDVAILNYALTLEYLEAAFYKEAVDRGALTGQLARFAEIVGAHEQAHVDALKKTLGSNAVKEPTFDFKGTTDSESTFGDTAKVLEDTGVRAYQGQATAIKDPAVLRAAISIHPVEARHAAWIASILGKGGGQPSPAPEAFNPAADMATILAEVQATGFITTEQGASPSTPVSGSPNVAG
jgi:rubrerythrin